MRQTTLHLMAGRMNNHTVVQMFNAIRNVFTAVCNFRKAKIHGYS
jgi:hypothetical protein